MVTVAELKPGDAVATHLYHESDETKFPFSTVIGTVSRIDREVGKDVVAVYLALACDFRGDDDTTNAMVDAGWGPTREVEFGASMASKVVRLAIGLGDLPGSPSIEARWTRVLPRGSAAFYEMAEIGAIQDGDEFYFKQPRIGNLAKFTFVVTPSKRGLRGPDGKIYTSPSSASQSISKGVTNGWSVLRSVQSNKTLGQMLDELNASVASN